MKYDLQKLFSADYGKRKEGIVSYNRARVAIWLALYGYYYNMDAPHLFGWAVETSGINKGNLLLVGHTPGEGSWFTILHEGWEDDFPAYMFNEFDLDDLDKAQDAGLLEDKTSVADLHTLYAPIATQQYKAKFNIKPRTKDLIDAPDSDTIDVNPKREKQPKKPKLTLVGEYD